MYSIKEIVVVWLVHTPAGVIGLVAAIVALFTRKGSALHRMAGRYFTGSMLVMLVSGFVAAFFKASVVDMLLSAVVLYTVFTAWLTVYHKKKGTGFLELMALVWIIAVAIASLLLSLDWDDASTPNVYPYWASFAIFCAIGDIHNLYRHGLSSVQRLLRHVWRIGFSLLWAALAVTDKIIKMQGLNIKELPNEQLPYLVAAPALLILVVTLYWMVNLLFFSREWFARRGK